MTGLKPETYTKRLICTTWRNDMTQRTRSRLLSSHWRVHPLFSRLLLTASKAKHPHMPVDAAHCCPDKANSAPKCYSLPSRLCHRSVWRSSSSPVHRSQHPPMTRVLPACWTCPTAPSCPSSTEWNRLRVASPPLSPHHLSLSFTLCLPRWNLDSGRRGRQTDLCGAIFPPPDCDTVQSLCRGHIGHPCPLPLTGHSLHPLTLLLGHNRIATIVFLLRAAWHQLGPVSNTGAIICELHDIRMNWALVITVACNEFHLHPHVYHKYS